MTRPGSVRPHTPRETDRVGPTRVVPTRVVPTRVGALLVVALALSSPTLVSCATTPAPTAFVSPRSGALAELRAALTARLPAPTSHSALPAARRADQALLARLDEAFGAEPAALSRWLTLLDDPRWGPWATSRALGLVDRAPLDPAALARATAVPAAAELAEAMALRLGDAASLEVARARLGTRFTYRVTDRLLSYPGRTASSPVRAGFGQTRQVQAGLLASPESGPGLYAFDLDLPAGLPLEVLVDTEASWVAHLDEAARPVATHPALERFLPTRQAFTLPASGAPRRLQLLVTTRSRQATARVFARPAASDPSSPDTADLAASASTLRGVAATLGSASTLPGVASTLAAFDRAVAATDLEGVADTLAALPPGALRELLTAHAALADPSLPVDLRRERARASLTRALGDSPTPTHPLPPTPTPTTPPTACQGEPCPARRPSAFGEPQLTEARALLAALALEEQALDDAQDALAPFLAPADAPHLASADAPHLAPSEAPETHPSAATATPPRELVDLLADLDPVQSRTLATRRLDLLPTSCSAFESWLDAHWEDLRYRDELARRLASPAFALAPLPGPCLETRLRALDLLAETSALDPQSPVLTALASLDPGPARARAALLSARLELARGRWPSALDAARRALAEGGVDALASELAARAQRLLDRAGPPPLHPGLPLRPAAPLIAAFLKRAGPLRPDAQHGVEVLLHDRHLLVQADGSIVERLHRLVRVNDVASVESVGELPLPDDAEVLVARTWKPRSSPRAPLPATPLEPEEILEKATISLPALAPGDFAEWAWIHTIPADPRLAPGWRAPVHAFDDADGPTTSSRFTVTLAPGARPPTFSFEPRLAAPTRPDPSTWVFGAEQLPRVLGEPMDPRPDVHRLTVRASSGLDLLRWGDSLAAELASQTRPSPVLADHLAQATASLPEAASSEATLRALYDYTRRIIDEPPDVAPLSGDASFIGARRRGSRVLFLLGLCRQAGLACDPILARPLWEGRDGRDPDLDGLSYGLVRGPAGTEPGLGATSDPRASRAWLDPSGRWMPYGLLPPSLEGVSALALPPPTASPPPAPYLLVTPSLPTERWGVRRVALHLSVKADGKAVIATGVETLDGLFASSWRTALAGMTVQARTKILGAIVLQALPTAAVDEVILEGLDDERVPLTWRWRATTVTQPGADTSGRGSRTRTLALQLFPEGLARGTVVLPTRETALLVNRAARMDLTLTVDAGPGWGFPSGPADLTVRWPTSPSGAAGAGPREYGVVALERRTTFENEGRRVVVHKRFDLRPTIVEPSEYTAWSAAAQAVDRADVLQLVLAPAATEPSLRGVSP